MKAKPLILRRKDGGYDMILDYVLTIYGDVMGVGERYDITEHVFKMLKELLGIQKIIYGPTKEKIKLFAKKHYPFLQGRCQKNKDGEYSWTSIVREIENG